MKLSSFSLTVFLVFCFCFNTPKAFAQNFCPLTEEDIKKDKDFMLTENKCYKSEYVECAYGYDGKLLREIPYVVGKAEGIYKEYYASGKLREETPLFADKAEGISRQYYESGELESETNTICSR